MNSECLHELTGTNSSFYDLTQDLSVFERPLNVTSYPGLDHLGMDTGLNEIHLSVSRLLDDTPSVTTVDIADTTQLYSHSSFLYNNQHIQEPIDNRFSQYSSTVTQPNMLPAISSFENDFDRSLNWFNIDASQALGAELCSLEEVNKDDSPVTPLTPRSDMDHYPGVDFVLGSVIEKLPSSGVCNTNGNSSISIASNTRFCAQLG